MAAGDHSSDRTLIVGCYTGLGDRLAVLLSSLALAETSGRRLVVLWPRTVHCSAAFTELFQASWPVSEVPEAEVRSLPQFDIRDRRKRFDLLNVQQSHVGIRAYGWLLAPDRYPAHGPMLQRCIQLLQELHPRPEILRRVDEFRRAAFRAQMIGVHMRRGEYQFFDARAAGSTQPALEAVDGFLASYPSAGILLCTDDGAIDPFTGCRAPVEGIRPRFLARYGDRVVSTKPRSLDRRSPLAIQDALVDLLLLRETDCLVGTKGSSFSAMAAFGRSVPVVWCRSANPFLHLRPLWLWAQGVARPSTIRHYYGRITRHLLR